MAVDKPSDKDTLIETLLQERDELYQELSRLRESDGGNLERYETLIREMDKKIRHLDGKIKDYEDKVKDYEDVLSKKETEEGKKGLTEDVLKIIESEILGI